MALKSGSKRARRLAVGLAAAVLGVAGYFLWSRCGRSIRDPDPELRLEDVSSFGQDGGRGNIVAVQAHMEVIDYASEDHFFEKLDGYLAEAQRQGWLGPRTIVVFPEYIGTWLVAAGEKATLYQAPNIEEAMTQMALSNLPAFVTTLPRAQGEDRVRDSLFRMKAASMTHIYQDTFSRLARDYGVTIMAGSIVLPAPQINGDVLETGRGAHQNVSVVFDPQGRLHPAVVRKVYPTREEHLFMEPAPSWALPVFDTPAGRLSVLICADSWYPDVYEALALLKPELVVVPSNSMPAALWDELWEGYNPGPMPADVDAQDVGRLTEGEAWLKYALAGRLASSGARAGVNLFSRGRLWDLDMGGYTIIVNGEEVYEAPDVPGAALVNVWLP